MKLNYIEEHMIMSLYFMFLIVLRFDGFQGKS